MTENADSPGAGPTAPRSQRPSRAALKRLAEDRYANMGRELTGHRPDLVPPARPESAPFASLIRLTLAQVDRFERNPREGINSEYAGIKESIRAIGLEHRMTVTRRPGEEKYVLARGGGTRYDILWELWQETGDRQFYELDFDLVDYQSESKLLASHLSENLHRADMCFWDLARSFTNLKADLEMESGETLSPKQAVERFAELGLPKIGRSLLQLYLAATDMLHSLGEAAFFLTLPVVQDLLWPRYNALRDTAVALQIGRADFDRVVWQPSLESFSRQWNPSPGHPKDPAQPDLNEDQADQKPSASPNWEALIALVSDTLATEARVPAEAIPIILDTLRMAPDTSRDDLLAVVAAHTAERHHPPQESKPTAAASANSAGQSPVADPGHRSQAPRLPGVYEVRTQSAGAGDVTDEGGGDVPGREGGGSGATLEGDGDRPPGWRIAEKEAEDRQRREAARQAGAKPHTAELPPALPSGGEHHPPQPPHAAPAGSSERRQAALIELARNLASSSPTLANLVMVIPGLPMGWMVDLPPTVLTGSPMPPQAKQMFRVLSAASFQLHIGLRCPELVAGTQFGQFLASLPLDHAEEQTRWALVEPSDPDRSEFLFSWLLDPAYHVLGDATARLYTATKQVIADHPDEYLALGDALDFQYLKEGYQSQRWQAETEALNYFAEAGATPEMAREFFPHCDLSVVRFRPGRIAELDLKLEQFRIFELWSQLGRQLASERDRLIALHRQFPSVSIASLYQAVMVEV